MLPTYDLKSAARYVGDDVHPISPEAIRRKVLQLGVADRDELGRLTVPGWVVEVFRQNWRSTGFLGKRLPSKPDKAA